MAQPPRQTVDLLVLGTSGELGGAERALLDLVAGLRERDAGLLVAVVIPSEGPLAKELAHTGARVLTVPLPPAVARLGDSGATRAGAAGRARRLAGVAVGAALALPALAAYVTRLRRVVRRLAPRVIHANGLKAHVIASLVAPSGTAVIWHLHDFVGSRALMAPLLRLLAGRCRAAIANSHSVAADADRALRGRVPITTVHNAVNLRRFDPHGTTLDLDARAGMAAAAAGTVRVGLVATMAWWKGHEVFLRAVARLARMEPHRPVRAYVVSGPVYTTVASQSSIDQLRALAKELGIAHLVGFTGFVEDTASAMRALDVVVHASTEPEPFGLVIAEAMASGRAVVLSAAGGATELAEDGVSALYHRPGDDEELASRLHALVVDAALRERLGRAATARARRLFDRARYAAAIADVHARAAGAFGTVAPPG